MTEQNWPEPLVDEDGMEAETASEVDEDGLEPEVTGRPAGWARCKCHSGNHAAPGPSARIDHTY
jgi:hypothetical protein